MVKIDIFSGFLGAGKTTLIKKLISEAYCGEKVVLIENEFGEIGIDGGFLQDAGINITEMNSGCICCSLVGDFSKALRKVTEEYAPERIIIEPSGVGKLSDIVVAVNRAGLKDAEINALCAVVDASKCRMYIRNFGEFFNDQIKSANCIVMSHADKCSEAKLAEAVSLVRGLNAGAILITTPLTQLSGKDILTAMENRDTLEVELEQLAKEHREHHHHHHHDEDDEEEHEHHHHHDDDEDDEEEEHHHHHHDGDDEDEEDEEEHHHHHHHHDDEEDDEDNGDECCCGHHHDEDGDGEHHHHHHHHDHDADEVFTSFGAETTRKYTTEEINAILVSLQDEEKYGMILRAKGIVDSAANGGRWLHFDYVPGEPDVREGSAGVTGRLCVIGCNIREDALKELFSL